MNDRISEIGRRISVVFLVGLLGLAAGNRSLPQKPQVQKETKKMDKETLAARVEKAIPDVAEKIRAERTTIDRIETPFFADGGIYRVMYPSKYRPITFVFGVARKDYAVPLAKNPKGFAELAQTAGLDLSTDSLRLSYVEAFLESTRDFQSRFQILRSFDDIELINKASEEEKRRYEDLKNKYRSTIKPPEVSGKEINLFVLKRQDLLRLVATVSDDGKIDIKEEILEKDLPIAYVK
jgi:hypothetical protein